MEEVVGHVHNGMPVFRTLSYLMVPLICRALFTAHDYRFLFSIFPTQAQLDSVGIQVDWSALCHAIKDIIIHIPNFEVCIVVSAHNHIYVQSHLQDILLNRLQLQHTLLYQSMHACLVEQKAPATEPTHASS